MLRNMHFFKAEFIYVLRNVGHQWLLSLNARIVERDVQDYYVN